MTNEIHIGAQTVTKFLQGEAATRRGILSAFPTREAAFTLVSRLESEGYGDAAVQARDIMNGPLSHRWPIIMTPGKSNWPTDDELVDAIKKNVAAEINPMAVLRKAAERTEPKTEHVRMDVEGYGALALQLIEAYEQSAKFKGRERHAGSPVGFRSWDQQPILQIGRMVGPGYAIGQVMKKAQEAFMMTERNDFDAAMAELLGVIVYAAAARVLVEEIKSSRSLTSPASPSASR